MSALTYVQLLAVISTAMTTTNISSGYTPTATNTAALLNKIGKITMLDTTYEDKLALFDGEDLPLGKIVEEYSEDLIAPIPFDATGSDALAPHYASYRPNFYSYPIDEVTFPITKKYNDLEKAMNSNAELAEAVSKLFKKQEDSKASYRYGLKRVLLGKAIALAEAEQTSTTAYTTGTAYEVTTGNGSNLAPVILQKTGDTTRAIVFKKISQADNTSWADLVKNGFLVPLDLVTNIAQPTDEATGEAFIEQLKKDVEIASDLSQGHSLNGNALGVADAGYVIIVKQGIMPTLETKVMAGAFQLDKIAMPAEVIRVPDFGDDESGAYAVLVDRRILRMHLDYQATRPQENGKGDFMTMYAHLQFTPFFSRNLFFKVYKNA